MIVGRIGVGMQIVGDEEVRHREESGAVGRGELFEEGAASVLRSTRSSRQGISARR